ncbi:MAG TPA: nitrate/nitrite transporter NrtS, partial [Rhodanobacteraceae bacterium]|nr:nitrate/nitrite transporter NrtS [Rhodanobacteraceae bacterium]
PGSSFDVRRYPRAMITTLKTFARVVTTPVHLKRTLLIAFVVGSWLNLFNHGDELLRGAVGAHLAVKLALNYLTPFVVSNFGLLAHRRA